MSVNQRHAYAPGSGRRPDPALARRRIVAGAILGLLVQVVLAIALGLIPTGGGGLGALLAMGAYSSMIATPACFAAAFALMLARAGRQLGVGVLIGAVLGTLLLMGGCAVT